MAMHFQNVWRAEYCCCCYFGSWQNQIYGYLHGLRNGFSQIWFASRTKIVWSSMNMKWIVAKTHRQHLICVACTLHFMHGIGCLCADLSFHKPYKSKSQIGGELCVCECGFGCVCVCKMHVLDNLFDMRKHLHGRYPGQVVHSTTISNNHTCWALA